jgi:G3E family GTPase
MAAATFDTLKFANTPKAAGVPSQQAEAQAVAFAEIIQVNFKDLVTKDDLARAVEEIQRKLDKLRDELQIDVRELRESLETQGRQLRAEMKTTDARYRGGFALLKWMLGASLTATVGILVQLFFIRPL